MIVYCFTVTDAFQARLLQHVCRLGTFRNADLIAAIRDAAASGISVAAAQYNIEYSNCRRANVGETCMRVADALIKLWKKRGAIRQGTKRGDWIIKTVKAEESWGR